MKTRNIILWVILNLVILLWIVDCSKPINPNPVKITDTVYLNKNYKPLSGFKIPEIPSKVYIYNSDTTKIPKLELTEENNLVVDSDTVSREFFIYNWSRRLLDIELKNSSLKLSLQNVDGSVFTEKYDLDLINKDYRYTDNHLTFKNKSIFRKLEFQPTIAYSYKPLNNHHELDFSLKLKTTNFNYKAGISFNNYNQSVKPDLIVGIEYQINFKSWLRK